uniref:Uncharacterized protein n=1 Tax=Glycine max TaxID=3847 RepID=C6T8U0_SOYBN|nr:unknown [Glycine max]
MTDLPRSFTEILATGSVSILLIHILNFGNLGLRPLENLLLLQLQLPVKIQPHLLQLHHLLPLTIPNLFIYLPCRPWLLGSQRDCTKQNGDY